MLRAAIGQSTSRHTQDQTKGQKQGCQSSHHYSLLFASYVSFDVMFLYRTPLVLSMKFFGPLNFRKVLRGCDVALKNGTDGAGLVGSENRGHVFPVRRVRVPPGSPAGPNVDTGRSGFRWAEGASQRDAGRGWAPSYRKPRGGFRVACG